MPLDGRSGLTCMYMQAVLPFCFTHASPQYCLQNFCLCLCRQAYAEAWCGVSPLAWGRACQATWKGQARPRQGLPCSYFASRHSFCNTCLNQLDGEGGGRQKRYVMKFKMGTLYTHELVHLYAIVAEPLVHRACCVSSQTAKSMMDLAHIQI